MLISVYLQVASACNFAFLDGSETAGSRQVGMIAKFGRHTAMMLFQVWFPELPLEIYLSDDKLSQIKQWRVPGGSDRCVL